jgi:hypothetical protein
MNPVGARLALSAVGERPAVSLLSQVMGIGYGQDRICRHDGAACVVMYAKER